MATLTIDRSSLQRVLQNARRRLEEMERDARNFVEKRARDVLQESEELVPVDIGELRDSGRYELDRLGAVIIFDAEHAAVIHEDMTLRHARGQAKYLEAPIRRQVPRFAKDLAAAVKI